MGTAAGRRGPFGPPAVPGVGSPGDDRALGVDGGTRQLPPVLGAHREPTPPASDSRHRRPAAAGPLADPLSPPEWQRQIVDKPASRPHPRSDSPWGESDGRDRHQAAPSRVLPRSFAAYEARSAASRSDKNADLT